jgi:hypothetical protein
LLDDCYSVCRYIEQRSEDGRKQALAAAGAYRDFIQQQKGETEQKGGIRESKRQYAAFSFPKKKGERNMKCIVCGRTLRDPVSVSRRMGPVCFNRRLQTSGDDGGEKAADILLPPDPRGDIVLRRIAGKPATNVPHYTSVHSPSGYEWGYAGSGPADLALNILMMFVDPDEAERLHQEFKQAFIATLPEEGGVIKREDIEHWIAAHTGTLQLRFLC